MGSIDRRFCDDLVNISSAQSYARHVGRVGALAVALGIGFAVAMSPGVAVATPETGSESDTTAEPSDQDDDPEDPEPENAEDDAENPDEDLEPEQQELEQPDDEVIDDEDPESVEDPNADEDLDTDETGDGDGAAPELVPDTPTAPDTVVVQSRPEPQGAARSAATAGPAVVDTPELPDAAPPLLVTTTDDETYTAATLFTEAPEPALHFALSEPVAPPASLAAPAHIVTSLVATLLTPFLGQGPAAPAHAPVLWAVLAWVRREIGRTFFNQSPTLVDNQDSELVDEDTVTGTVTGTDPNTGDVLTYTYSGGAPGADITVDEDGTWTYTAPANWDGEQEWTDTFQITVSDESSKWHWHGLLGFLKKPSVHRDTVTVSVAVPSQIAPNPIITELTSDEVPDPDTGAVTYRVVVRDFDNDGLPPALTSSDPENGSVTVTYVETDVDGAHHYDVVYTPDPTARLTAFGSPTPVVDTITLTAADGDPRNVDATSLLDVTVDPAAVVVTDSIAVTVPAGGRLVLINTSPDGSYFVVTEQPSSTDPTVGVYVLSVLRPGPDGPAWSTELDGEPVSGIVFGEDGTAAVYTRSGAGNTTDPYEHAVVITRPGGTPETVALTGQPGYYPAVAPDGTVVTTSYTEVGGEVQPIITAIRPGQPPQEFVDAEPPASEVAVGTDVVTYLVGEEDDLEVLVVRSGAEPVTYALPGNPETRPSVVGENVVVTSYSGAGTAADPLKTHVTVIRPGQAPATTTVDGYAVIPPTLSADDTLAVVTVIPGITASDPDVYKLYVARPGQPLVSTTLAGHPQHQPVTTDDGTVVVTAPDGETNSQITIVRPGQAAVSSPITGTPFGMPPSVGGEDGVVVAQITASSSGAGPTYHVTVIRPGQAPVTTTISPQALGSEVTDDGTVLVLSGIFLGIPGSTPPTELTILRPGQTAETISDPGAPGAYGEIDGAYYLITGTADAQDTVITVLRPGQATPDRVVVDGVAASLTEQDGKIYLTTITPVGVSGPRTITMWEISQVPTPADL